MKVLDRELCCLGWIDRTKVVLVIDKVIKGGG
jgi:hypothetical protein